jgi:hypothetical protein
MCSKTCIAILVVVAALTSSEASGQNRSRGQGQRSRRAGWEPLIDKREVKDNGHTIAGELAQQRKSKTRAGENVHALVDQNYQLTPRAYDPHTGAVRHDEALETNIVVHAGDKTRELTVQTLNGEPVHKTVSHSTGHEVDYLRSEKFANGKLTRRTSIKVEPGGGHTRTVDDLVARQRVVEKRGLGGTWQLTYQLDERGHAVRGQEPTLRFLEDE